MLHGFTSEARLVREKKATPILFAWGSATPEALQDVIDAVPDRPAIVIHVSAFLSAVESGRQAFLAHLEADAGLIELANTRAPRIFKDMPADLAEWIPKE